MSPIHKVRRPPIDKVTFFDVRDRVQMCRRRAEDISAYQDRIYDLWDRATAMGSGEISDMPRAPMSSTSKIAEIIEKKVDLEILLLELKEVQKRETKYVRRVVDKLQRADDKKIILMRYVDQRSWDSILKAVYGKEIDFGGKEESYERKMYRRHNAAIDSMYSISKRDRIW